MMVFPCFFLREKQHNRINTREETLGESKVLFAHCLNMCMPRQGKRWQPSATGVGNREQQRSIRRSPRPDTSLARFSISFFEPSNACVLTIRCLTLAKPEESPRR